jgi:urea transport system ATP-binding protein
MNSEALIEIKDLSCGYMQESMAIRNVSLAVAPGELFAVIGSNGAGKSTLLKAIMGLLPCAAGEIWFNGENITRATPDARAAMGIGYVPQGRFIFPYLTVEENLLLGCEARRMPVKAARDLAYGFFPSLESIAGRKGGMLSGGQQQQLAIARILVTRPRLLVLDEPTEGIQPSIVKDIGRILQQVQQSGMTVLLVEQFVSFAVNISSHYFLMQSGAISRNGHITAGNRKAVIEGITL